MNNEHVSEDFCPKCRANLQGQPIPEKDRQNFGKHTHFSRKVALNSWELDRALAYKCPDCGHTWKVD